MNVSHLPKTVLAKDLESQIPHVLNQSGGQQMTYVDIMGLGA